jgi:hypothetical protein
MTGDDLVDFVNSKLFPYLISGKIGLIKIIKCLYQEPCRANCTIINAIAYFRRDYLYNGFNQWTRSVVFSSVTPFKGSAESANTIEYKIGEIFSELKNRIQGGYNLREVLNLINELRFRTHH